MLLRNPFAPRPIKAYWWKQIPNFGDALAPLLLERYAGVKVEWDTVSHASLITVGSILEHVPPLWDGTIIGAGRISEKTWLHLHTNTAKIISLRGPLSARGIQGSFALGDPGVLAHELVGPQEKQWDLGILPHVSDIKLAARFTNLIPAPHTCMVINPKDSPLDVLRQIGSCRRLVTSSLHGMIAADGFAIPRRVEMCEGTIRDGGDFKFRDYSESIGHQFVAGKMSEPSRFRVEDVQFAAYDAYQYYKAELCKSHGC